MLALILLFILILFLVFVLLFPFLVPLFLLLPSLPPLAVLLLLLLLLLDIFFPGDAVFAVAFVTTPAGSTPATDTDSLPPYISGNWINMIH